MSSDSVSAISLLLRTCSRGYYCCRWIRKDMTIVEQCVVLFFCYSLLFACCCFLHYWRVVTLTALQATTVVYFLCCCVWSSECTTDFSGYFISSWTGNEQEWTWCCSRMDIRVCMVFSFSVFFVVIVLYLFVRFFLLGSWALVWPRVGSLRSANVWIKSNHTLDNTICNTILFIQYVAPSPGNAYWRLQYARPWGSNTYCPINIIRGRCCNMYW